MGAVPASTSALPTLSIIINPHSHSDQHLLYGGGYLRHDGGGRVEDGRGGRGSWQTAADVLVPANTNTDCDHDGGDHDGTIFQDTLKNTHRKRIKQIKPCVNWLISKKSNSFFNQLQNF